MQFEVCIYSSNPYACFVVLSDGEEERADGGGFASVISEVAPSLDAALVTAATAYLGLLCPPNFKFSVGATRVCEEVARFVAPSYLFWNMSLNGMFWYVEANVVMVRILFY